MSSPRQGDLFADDQPGPADDDTETPCWYPDPDRVRAELNRILAEARAAQAMPWDDSKLGLYELIFPQMSNALPEDEAAQLCFQFETELERLKAA